MKSSRISDKQWIDKDMHVITQQVKIEIFLQKIQKIQNLKDNNIKSAANKRKSIGAGRFINCIEEWYL